jgi:hypothetical protein
MSVGLGFTGLGRGISAAERIPAAACYDREDRALKTGRMRGDFAAVFFSFFCEMMPTILKNFRELVVFKGNRRLEPRTSLWRTAPRLLSWEATQNNAVESHDEESPAAVARRQHIFCGAISPFEILCARCRATSYDHATYLGDVRTSLSAITARLPSVKYGSPVRLCRGCAGSQAPTPSE